MKSRKKSFYVVLVSRDEDGSLRRVPVPLHFAWGFAVAAVVGMFTLAGLAGSYSRMLLKAERFNQLRSEHNALMGDYARLEKREKEKEVQAASLGALASEVSALYGLTANKIASGVQSSREGSAQLLGKAANKSAGTQSGSQIVETTASDANFSNASYYKSVSDFYTLRNSALSGSVTRSLNNSFTAPSLGGFGAPLGGNLPTLWPVLGVVTSPFGAREDPILGAGEGEFHKGVDISAPYGTPIRATADGTVEFASIGNGFGKEIVLDHGGGVKTLYAHMSGFHCTVGDQVVRGQIIGYVGMTGRSTGAHVHYEVHLRNVPVNPHKYLQNTGSELGTQLASK